MKKLIELPFIRDLARNLKETPQFLQVILGPRQVGKTTTTLKFFEDNFSGKSLFVNAENVFSGGHEWLVDHWQRARSEGLILVIDEIQKIENWSETVKRLWDEDKRMKAPIKCVLLGSSSLKIQRGLTESLTGRFQLIRAHHWNFSESREAYGLSLNEFLEIGGYPGSYDLGGDRLRWADYVQSSILETVIEKDILQSNTVKSPALFRQAFEILCAHPAQEVSYTKLLGQLQDKGNTELIKNYIRLYEGAFLVRALDKFSTNKIKLKVSSPKILPLCPALYYLSEREGYEATKRGRAFELLVGAQLVRTGQSLYYWREGKHEVDYVLKYGKHVWGIEVKSGKRRAAGGLLAFQEKFPGSRAVIITPDNYDSFEAGPEKFLGIV